MKAGPGVHSAASASRVEKASSDTTTSTGHADRSAKEGNLRYFYEIAGGYERCDFVVQMDSDQVPDRSYLAEILRPLADPTIGYVAAPSVCDNNALRSWSARGRLFVDSPWHGSVQCGYNDGFTPQCIGSHYVVRTRALREIGGLGPELAEDFSTTLMKNAHGWRGAFAPSASAHGDGPANLADCLTQEFQWSRSIVRIMLLHSARYWRPLPLNLKVKVAFCQLWYPIFTLHLLAVYMLPVVAILTHTPWVRVNLLYFFFFAALATAPGIAIVSFTRRLGCLRPTWAPVLSWEAALFQFVRWPWMLAGVLDGVVGVLLRREMTFRVTPKGDTSRPMPWHLLAPYLALVAVEAGVVQAVPDPGPSAGYHFLALLNAVIYASMAIALPMLHLLENQAAASTFAAYRYALLRAAPLLAGLSLLLGGVLLEHSQEALVLVIAPRETEPDVAVAPQPAVAFDALPSSQSDQSPPLQPTTTSSELIVGYPSRAAIPVLPSSLPPGRVAVGAYDPGGQLSGLKLDLEHWYVRQEDPESFKAALLANANRRAPLITVEPFPKPGQLEPVLDAIVAGQRDDQLRQLAAVARSSGAQIVLLRWAHEMELSGLYPWAANEPALYRAGHRRVVNVFRSEGADNIRWVWSPAGDPKAAAYYPGDDVVDYAGLTVLGDETWDALVGLPAQPFADLLSPRYQRVIGFGKPIIVAELGVSGSADYQADWLAAAARSLDEFPGIAAISYFQAQNPAVSRVPTRPDWRVAPPRMARSLRRLSSWRARPPEAPSRLPRCALHAQRLLPVDQQTRRRLLRPAVVRAGSDFCRSRWCWPARSPSGSIWSRPAAD